MQIFEAIIEAFHFDAMEASKIFHQYYQSVDSAKADMGARKLRIASEKDWTEDSRGDSFYDEDDDVKYVSAIHKIEVLP